MIETEIRPHVTTVDGDRWTCLCGATTTGTDPDAAADAHVSSKADEVLAALPADQLGALLTATAAGGNADRHLRAATAALVDHGHWLHIAAVRPSIHLGWSEDGRMEAYVRWYRLAELIEERVLLGSSSEVAMLRFAASLAAVGVGVDLGDLIMRLGPAGKKDVRNAVTIALGL